jgi:hypothetical protein
METPERPKMMMHGELVDIPDDAYEAWVANGCPTEPPRRIAEEESNASN